MRYIILFPDLFDRKAQGSPLKPLSLLRKPRDRKLPLLQRWTRGHLSWNIKCRYQNWGLAQRRRVSLRLQVPSGELEKRTEGSHLFLRAQRIQLWAMTPHGLRNWMQSLQKLGQWWKSLHCAIKTESRTKYVMNLGGGISGNACPGYVTWPHWSLYLSIHVPFALYMLDLRWLYVRNSSNCTYSSSLL